MTTGNNQDPDNTNADDNNTGDSSSNPNPDGNSSNVNIDKLVQEKVNEALKDIKGKLDKAYGARDEALRKIAEYEQKEREAELKRLQEEGKHKEAFEMQLAEERSRREALEKRNVELTRDIEVRNVLAALPFRNSAALEMAYKEIVGTLVKTEQGAWVHNSGTSIKDYVKSFHDSEDNSFLFKPKASSGSGSSGTPSNPPAGSDKASLFSLSQEEVIKRAREGKLRQR